MITIKLALHIASKICFARYKHAKSRATHCYQTSVKMFEAICGAGVKSVTLKTNIQSEHKTSKLCVIVVVTVSLSSFITK